MTVSVGSRKIVAFISILVVGTAMVVFYKDIPTNFLSLLQLGFGVFVAGNALEHTTNAYVSTQAPAPALAPPAQEAAPVDLTPVNNGIEEVKAEQTRAHDAIAIVQQGLSFIITRMGLDKVPPT